MNGKKHSAKKKKISASPTAPALPTHSWEAQPVANPKSSNKTFLITLITIALVVVLILFLFISTKFVGKAIEFGGNTIDLTINAEGKLTVTATLASGVRTGSVYFELTSPDPNFNLCGSAIVNRLWNQFQEMECNNNRLVFSDATLNPDDFKSGTFTIAELNPVITNLRQITLSSPMVDLYDSSTGADLFPAGGTFSLTIPDCGAGTTRTCGIAVGSCRAGTQSCTNGVWNACAGAIAPTTEICDDLDNDCDGSTDENQVCGQCNADTLNLCSTEQECSANRGIWTDTDENDDTSERSCVECISNAQCRRGEFCQRNECVSGMTITSTAFTTEDTLPEQYTCDGAGSNPPLAIRNIPAGTESLILILEDLDADLNPAVDPELPLVHWSVINIPITRGQSTLEIPSAATPASLGASARIQINEITQSRAYAAPCPPEGESHRYRFKAYALDTDEVMETAIVTQSDSLVRTSRVERALASSIITEASMYGIYYPAPVSAPAVSEPPRGGGGGCITQWSCSTQWSYCNATLQQSRSCTDLNRCDQRKLTKLDNRSCTACEESWVCTPWNACQNGAQTRNCVDEHSCGLAMQKPVLQKSCQVALPSGPAPARVEPQLPLPSPPVVQRPEPPAPSFWEQYQWFITGIPAALLVIILVIIGIVHALRSKSTPAAAVEYNLHELKEWVQKEKSAGTSKGDIKTMLAQHTGWSTGEIESRFTELKEQDAGTGAGSSPAGSPPAG